MTNNADKKTIDKSTKAYSNMMLYLRELKLHNEKSSEIVENLYTESQRTNKELVKIQDKQDKTLVDIDNDVRILKRELAVLSSTLDETYTQKINELENQLAKTKRSLTIYMRIILWVMIAILFVNIINFLPIGQFF